MLTGVFELCAEKVVDDVQFSLDYIPISCIVYLSLFDKTTVPFFSFVVSFERENKFLCFQRFVFSRQSVRDKMNDKQSIF